MDGLVELDLVSGELLNVFLHVTSIYLYAALGIMGLLFNFVNFTVFLRLGLSDTTNISLLALTVADIGVSLTMIGYSVINNPLLASITPLELIDAVNYSIHGTVHVLCCRIAGCLTAFISLERFVCVARPMHVKSIVTPERTKLVVFGVYAFMVACTIPTFVANQIGQRFDPDLNRTTYLIFTPDSDLLENFTFTVNVTVQLTSFVVVTASTLGLMRSLTRVARWRSSTASSVSKHARASSRDKQLVKMVVLISVVFIACSVSTVVGNLVMIFVKDFNVRGRHRNLFVLACVVFFILDSVNSTANIFIYFKMSSKFRENVFLLLPQKHRKIKA
ncbi:unnamed protein product [Lymnaea stagnalis]|uniref:G-protein coupled receptors family 1 profile domain-containing protein n=1 Tax=Lymnaea stagnalis TaxID=6523 RepID=A0AAV2HW34_LYMST